MTNSLENSYSILEKNVIDTIHEWQVKLGYTKEMMRIYYNRDSLEHLVGMEFDTNEEAKEFLIEWRESVVGRLGKIRLSNNGQRFCIAVPVEGIEYVYKYKQGNAFLVELMEVLKKPTVTIEDVVAVFKKQSNDVIVEKADHDEFDYVVYYKDNEDDKFRYCFSFGEMGAFYHRFLEYDYSTIRGE